MKASVAGYYGTIVTVSTPPLGGGVRLRAVPTKDHLPVELGLTPAGARALAALLSVAATEAE